jgi:hypothetical protein
VFVCNIFLRLSLPTIISNYSIMPQVASGCEHREFSFGFLAIGEISLGLILQLVMFSPLLIVNKVVIISYELKNVFSAMENKKNAILHTISCNEIFLFLLLVCSTSDSHLGSKFIFWSFRLV